ncbi:MAG: hypothetical protein JJ975_11080 [Bacteroidia bacterium]|nr:hypothetical protein [Bacteroidia bacterium]
MRKLLLAAIAGLFVGLVGCSDEGAEPTPEPKAKTNMELITEGSWRVEDGTISPSIDIDIQGNTITVNNYWDLLAIQGGGQVMDCDKDNIMILKSDSSVVLDEGPTKCDANDPQTQDGGKWHFMDNETKLKFSSFPFDPEGNPQVLDVDSLTSEVLHIRMIYQFVNPLDPTDISDHEIKLDYRNTN